VDGGRLSSSWRLARERKGVEADETDQASEETVTGRGFGREADKEISTRSLGLAAEPREQGSRGEREAEAGKEISRRSLGLAAMPRGQWSAERERCWRGG
jgi:hypothetical protein